MGDKVESLEFTEEEIWAEMIRQKEKEREKKNKKKKKDKKKKKKEDRREKSAVLSEEEKKGANVENEEDVFKYFESLSPDYNTIGKTR